MPLLFTDRRSGASLAPYESFNLALHVGDDALAVTQNRAQLQDRTSALQFMNQVHGEHIVRIEDVISDPTADALITTVPGIALAVLVADCIPLLLTSPEVVGAVHVGRRGLVNKIAVKTIARMRELGATSIHANLGPSICGRCYEVSQELADEVVSMHPEAAAVTGHGTPALDLPRALMAELCSVDVTYQALQICTLENSEYFSYRRHNITGRNAGVVWL